MGFYFNSYNYPTVKNIVKVIYTIIYCAKYCIQNRLSTVDLGTNNTHTSENYCAMRLRIYAKQ
jgi:hypothetical protein